MAAGSRQIRRIVVGVDGSPHSEAALEWAGRMAWGMDAEVIAVFAIAPPAYFPPPYATPVQLDPEWRAEMRSQFERQWCRPLVKAGVSYRTVMEDGRPASVIASVADAEDADVVVVGRRGRGAVAELLLGSVSHELTLHCSRPVLLISSAPGDRPKPAAVRKSSEPTAPTRGGLHE